MVTASQRTDAIDSATGRIIRDATGQRYFLVSMHPAVIRELKRLGKWKSSMEHEPLMEEASVLEASAVLTRTSAPSSAAAPSDDKRGMVLEDFVPSPRSRLSIVASLGAEDASKLLDSLVNSPRSSVASAAKSSNVWMDSLSPEVLDALVPPGGSATAAGSSTAVPAASTGQAKPAAASESDAAAKEEIGGLGSPFIRALADSPVSSLTVDTHLFTASPAPHPVEVDVEDVDNNEVVTVGRMRGERRLAGYVPSTSLGSLPSRRFTAPKTSDVDHVQLSQWAVVRPAGRMAAVKLISVGFASGWPSPPGALVLRAARGRGDALHICQ